MKKNLLYLSACVMLAVATTACHDPEYVLPTADRQGITSITALFTQGKYAEVEAAKLTVTDPDQTDFVIPIPWYYPEDSDNPTTEDDLKTMRVKVELDNNCTIDPPITILDLNQTHTFTFTNPQGEKWPITIRGERTRSSKCAVLAFTVNGDLSCIIDEENKTISIPTAADLTDATFECTLSPHATISPEPGTPMDMNEGATVTVTADNGTSKATYTLLKLVPEKVDNGIRAGSGVLKFEADLARMAGVTAAESIHPTLAAMGRYVVVNLGDGSTPFYIDKNTGSRVGDITLGNAVPTGCVSSDEAGHLLIANFSDGSTFSIWRSDGVDKAPVKLLDYENALNLTLGDYIQVVGDLDNEAYIVATTGGLYAQHFVRWHVTGGVVGQPEVVSINGVVQWNYRDNNTKVAMRSINPADGYFMGQYADGNDPFYFINGTTNTVVGSLGPVADGLSWGKKNAYCDSRIFNGNSYTVLYSMGYWPNWGLPGILYLLDTSSTTYFNGAAVNTASGLVATFGMTDYETIPYAGDSRCGDVVLMPTKDGYYLDLYYVSNTHLSVGCIEFDCIQK